ncbi:MAG: [protein-PII] uridylyltransferase [Thermodesulfovibrionales bacterium]
MRKNINELLCEETEKLIESGCDGSTITRQLTRLLDALLQEDFSSGPLPLSGGEIPCPKGLALVAVGGYGRGEIAPYSDIDIMLLGRERSREITGSAESALYRFWDRGLNISHCFRTLKESIDDAMSDLQTRTSLIESRYLAGDREVFDEYKRDIYPGILYKRRREFVGALLREIDTRHKTYGDSVYLLEPNIKEGRGGLRDIHSLSWLARVVLHVGGEGGLDRVLAPPEYRRFSKALDFLLRLRLCLHTASRRRNDILSFEFQKQVAGRAGFKNTKRFLAEEIMMRLFYRNARFIIDSLEKVMKISGRRSLGVRTHFPLSLKKISPDFFLANNEIIALDKGLFRNPDRIFEAFSLFARTGKRFSDLMREKIRSRFLFINKKTRSSRKSVAYFFEILRSERVYETLREMQDTGVLDRFLPEFGRVRHLVVSEPYHRYTVDEHTLIALRNLELLKQTREEKLRYLSDIMKRVEQDILFLSVLLHDIGKGVSRKHEEAGYMMLKGIMERFGVESEDRNRIGFLVKNHIFLSKLVMTRDADDPETIAQLAERVEHEENLNALYLMTYADMSAVNPHFWTEWKAFLFHDVYLKTKEHLQGNRRRYFSTADRKLREFVETMPERYRISSTDETLHADCLLAERAEKEGVALSLLESHDNAAELTIAAANKPGLFSRIVGVVSRSGLDIRRARLYTGDKGIVVDKIILSNWREVWWQGMEEQLKGDLTEAILSGTDAPPFQGRRSRAVPDRRFRRFIEIDNETSGDSTIIELLLPDRLGLLYDIATCLYGHTTDIVSAIITTEDGIAQDVFYVQHDGKKLGTKTSLDILASLREAEIVSE